MVLTNYDASCVYANFCPSIKCQCTSKMSQSHSIVFPKFTNYREKWELGLKSPIGCRKFVEYFGQTNLNESIGILLQFRSHEIMQIYLHPKMGPFKMHAIGSLENLWLSL